LGLKCQVGAQAGGMVPEDPKAGLIVSRSDLMQLYRTPSRVIQLDHDAQPVPERATRQRTDILETERSFDDVPILPAARIRLSRLKVSHHLAGRAWQVPSGRIATTLPPRFRRSQCVTQASPNDGDFWNKSSRAVGYLHVVGNHVWQIHLGKVVRNGGARLCNRGRGVRRQILRLIRSNTFNAPVQSSVPPTCAPLVSRQARSRESRGLK
jgi:hypothetical protein